MIRAAFPRPEPKTAKGRVRKCKICKAQFEWSHPVEWWCCAEHGAELSAQIKAKQERKAARADRAETKRKLDAFKTIPTLKAEVQVIFNKWVRTRDSMAGHGCICCGKFATAAALAQPGGAYDSCHYRSRGSADHLRFDERNAHLGLKDCNTWGHKDYRRGLIQRIGLEAVEALESDQAIVKWTRDDLLEIKEKYKRKLRELKG